MVFKKRGDWQICKKKYIKVQAVPVKRIDKAQAGLLKTNLEDILKELEKMLRKQIETEN